MHPEKALRFVALRESRLALVQMAESDLRTGVRRASYPTIDNMEWSAKRRQ